MEFINSVASTASRRFGVGLVIYTARKNSQVKFQKSEQFSHMRPDFEASDGEAEAGVNEGCWAAGRSTARVAGMVNVYLSYRESYSRGRRGFSGYVSGNSRGGEKLPFTQLRCSLASLLKKCPSSPG